ncbi:MAG: hypothetical protein ACTHMG_10240 [Sphingomonas sp.]
MSVAVTAAQLARTQARLGPSTSDQRARPAAADGGLDEAGLAAIDERLSALRDQAARHPDVAAEHLLEAAAVAPLVEIDGAKRFEDRSFDDLVEFAAEMPW